MQNQTFVRQTANGPVEGIEQTSVLGQKYYAFRGVPYAEPPITGYDRYTGEEVDRRFKAPVPIMRKWTEPLKVHDFADFCIPWSNNGATNPGTASKTSEDCLYVNIYVPGGGAVTKSVLVWIHGGGFVEANSGDLECGPDFLLSEDNIVVTVEFRVGIFGFMNLGTPEYSGNMGLKDQQLALKWIHENIENFSGNKNEILAFGESAGAASINFQMLNEESGKYFTRAYLTSGSALTSFAISKPDHMQRMKDFLKIYDLDELINYLKIADSEFLATQYYWYSTKSLTFPWVPTIEKPNAVNAFMTRTPDEIYSSGKASVKDTLYSINTKEILWFRPNYIDKTDPLVTEDWQESGVDLRFTGFNKNNHPKEFKQALEILRTDYYPDPTDASAVKYANIDLMSDLMFGDSILKGLILQANANNNFSGEANTYFFRFSINTGINRMELLNNLKLDHATHSDDFAYYFYCHNLGDAYDKHLEHKDNTYNAIMRMVKIITNFAKTGQIID